MPLGRMLLHCGTQRKATMGIDLKYVILLIALLLHCLPSLAEDVYVLTTRDGWEKNKAELTKILNEYVKPGTKSIGINWNLLDEFGGEIGQTYYKNTAQLKKDGVKMSKAAVAALESVMLKGTEVGTVKDGSAYKQFLGDK